MPKEVTVDDVKDEKGVEVNLEKPQKKEEPKYVTASELEEVRKQLNGISSTMRHVKAIPEQIEELRRQVSQNRTMTPAEKKEAGDDLDAMLEQGNWRTPVETLAERKVQEILRKREEEDFRRKAESDKLSTLEQSKKFVRERYPDIDDPDTEVAKSYLQVLNEHPEYLRSEYGPKLAMRDMEDKLREDGKLDQFTKKAVDKELQRQARTKATSAPSSPASGIKGGKVVLTKEQKEFCDFKDIPYETYAKMLQTQSASGRHEVEA